MVSILLEAKRSAETDLMTVTSVCVREESASVRERRGPDESRDLSGLHSRSCHRFWSLAFHSFDSSRLRSLGFKAILGLYWGYLGVIYVGEKKMETIIMG